MSGIGFATEPCQPPAWPSSSNSDYTNIRHVASDSVAQFTLIPEEPSKIPAPATLPLLATGLGVLALRNTAKTVSFGSVLQCQEFTIMVQ